MFLALHGSERYPNDYSGAAYFAVNVVPSTGGWTIDLARNWREVGVVGVVVGVVVSVVVGTVGVRLVAVVGGCRTNQHAAAMFARHLPWYLKKIEESDPECGDYCG